MPFIKRDGARIYWRVDGKPDRPALLLGNSLGTDHSLWDSAMPQLMQHFCVIRFDKRGHGASAVSPGSQPDDYSIEMLARDTLEVADAAGARRFHYAGISVGGMIGMWLGANAADRVERMVLSNTAAKMPSEVWAGRIAAVLAGGMAALVDSTMERWFTPAFLARNDEILATIRRTFLQVDPAGYIGCCVAIRDMDLRASLGRIATPTLVVTGTHDLGTPKTLGEKVADSIAGASCIELPMGHIPLPEQTSRFIAAATSFLLVGHKDMNAMQHEYRSAQG